MDVKTTPEGATESLLFSEHVPHDPLANLLARSADDPGAAFQPDVIEALAELRAQNRPAFEQLRAQLKAAKVRVTALDQAIALFSGSENQRQTQADLLLEIAEEAALFHTSDQKAYGDINVNNRRETWPINSKGFRRWLERAYYERHGGAANGESVQSALRVIEAKAHYDAPERPIYLRVGEHGGKFYIDLGDETWRAIEIDASGWRIISESPARFRRAAGMLALPEPTRGGTIKDLRRLVNVGSDNDFSLATAWLLAAFRPSGPYPVLIVTGEQGSAKSSFVRVLRSLIDPNSAGQRSLPRDDRDLFIAANNGHVLSFDNVSGLPAWISDTLCRLSTGGGYATRELYSDAAETLFDAMRPIALNGIEDIASRPDLAERALFLTLTPISETARKTEKALNADLDAVRPGILGALLDAVSAGLRRLPDTRLDYLPRMADFAIWATACGDSTLWPEGGLMSALNANRASAINDVIESDPVANAIREFMQAEWSSNGPKWEGNAKSLLDALNKITGDVAVKSRTWPGTPRALSGRVTRAATSLRAIGIDISHRKSGDRKFVISRTEKAGIFAPQPPAPPERAETGRSIEGGSPTHTAHAGEPTARHPESTGLPPAKDTKESAMSGDRGGTGAKLPTPSEADKTQGGGGWI